MPFLRHGCGAGEYDGVDATQDDEPVGHGVASRKKITFTTSLQSDSPAGYAQYHRDLAAYHRAKGDHATAKKHDAVVAKWEKRSRSGWKKR